MNQFRLDGKVALVCGGAGGMGAVIAETLMTAGAKVVVTDIQIEAGEKLVARLAGDVLFTRLDVTREADWEAAITLTIERFGGLDVMVNCAAIESAQWIVDSEFEDFERTMRINAGGVFLGMKHCIRAMRPTGAAGRGGSIVNISSTSAAKAVLAMSAYSGSKAAVLRMTKGAALEAARYGIRVNAIHPGLVKTEMSQSVWSSYVQLGLVPDLATAEKVFARMHPLGAGTSQDIANGALYLAADASRWVTGLDLFIDGGLTAG